MTAADHTSMWMGSSESGDENADRYSRGFAQPKTLRTASREGRVSREQRARAALTMSKKLQVASPDWETINRPPVLQ